MQDALYRDLKRTDALSAGRDRKHLALASWRPAVSVDTFQHDRQECCLPSPSGGLSVDTFQHDQMYVEQPDVLFAGPSRYLRRSAGEREVRH